MASKCKRDNLTFVPFFMSEHKAALLLYYLSFNLLSLAAEIFLNTQPSPIPNKNASSNKIQVWKNK